jgi:hypothetical protein
MPRTTVTSRKASQLAALITAVLAAAQGSRPDPNPYPAEDERLDGGQAGS